MNAFWTAVRFLTCLPAPRLGQPGPADVIGSLLWFPPVGAGVGLLAGAVELAARSALPLQAPACALAVAVLLLVTGARPLIGLMVLAGALFSGRNAEGVARLACRRTPAPSGLLVGIGAVLLKYALLLALSGHQRLPALILAAALGRTAVVWICWRFRYAGLDTGIAEWLTSLASPRDLALCLPVLALSFGLLGPLVTPAAVMGTWLLAHGFSYWVSKVLGGLMAHNLDAAAELGELGALGAMIALTHVQGLA